jgi:hypothetical protein
MATSSTRQCMHVGSCLKVLLASRQSLAAAVPRSERRRRTMELQMKRQNPGRLQQDGVFFPHRQLLAAPKIKQVACFSMARSLQLVRLACQSTLLVKFLVQPLTAAQLISSACVRRVSAHQLLHAGRVYLSQCVLTSRLTSRIPAPPSCLLYAAVHDIHQGG